MAPLTWLITGCSSGYGEYLAEIAAERGENVIATARKPEKIASRITEKPNVKVLQLDLTESSTSIAKKVEKALELFGGIDVLVNNAGYPCVGPFEEIRYVGNVGRATQLNTIPCHPSIHHGSCCFLSSMQYCNIDTTVWPSYAGFYLLVADQIKSNRHISSAYHVEDADPYLPEKKMLPNTWQPPSPAQCT